MIKLNIGSLQEKVDYHKNCLKSKINLPPVSKYNTEEILEAKPEKLKEIAIWFSSLDDTTQKEFDFFIDLYKNFTTKKKEYNAYDLAKSLSVNSCVYCNRNYTFTVIKSDKEKIMRPDFDHFYNKDKYPILALSFYNLIPSCTECNRTLKQKKDFTIDTHIHPYYDSLDDYAKFKLKINKVDFYRNENSIEILFNSKNKKAQNSINDLELEYIYNHGYKDIVKELLQKRVMYSDSYIDELFDKYSGILFSSKEELMRLITCGYISDDDINKRPLSKLIKDISEDLGFI